MIKLEWSPRAERELAQLREYIALDSPHFALLFVERIVLSVERLSVFPRSGRPTPEWGYNDRIREVIVQGYRVIYRIIDETHIQIVTVVHGSRNLRIEPPIL
ncbi:MAG: hypothetical protein AMXMBFR82_38910 [Candidatus Hydrogenedentota bacterium]